MVKPQSCIPLRAEKQEEEYKTHSKTYASIQNSKKVSTAENSQVFRKGLSSSVASRNISRLAQMYEKAERQYFSKIGVQGELEFE